jgi:hypothetical protein
VTSARGATLSRIHSPALLRHELENVSEQESALVQRRIVWIWGLLFLNVMPYSFKSTLLPLPTSLGKILTQGALVAALVLAASINRKVLLRPNLFLLLMTVLCVTSLMMSVRGYFGLGTFERAARLAGFVAVLWLLTPWWGRNDFLIFRAHRKVIYVLLAVVLLGVVLYPGRAFSLSGGGRLGGVIWPIPPPTVADLAAVLAGSTIILWFAGMMKPRTSAVITVLSVVVVALTHTRTALIGLFLGVLVAGLSLFLSRKRVRKALAIFVVVGSLTALTFAPFLGAWFARGESREGLVQLSGRTSVWSAIVSQPRTEVNTLFGYGITNGSYDGLSIDSTWLTTYIDQGLFGDVIDAALLLALFAIALSTPRGPRKALALFLTVYCLVLSITEVGLGQATEYMLDLAVAMSLLMPPMIGPSELTSG